MPDEWRDLDVAFSHEVLYLLSDLADHAAAIRRCLRPSGVYFAVMGVHTGSPLMVEWHAADREELQLPPLYDIDDVIATFRRAGFNASVARLATPFRPAVRSWARPRGSYPRLARLLPRPQAPTPLHPAGSGVIPALTDRHRRAGRRRSPCDHPPGVLGHAAKRRARPGTDRRCCQNGADAPKIRQRLRARLSWMSRFTDLPLEPLSDHYGFDRGTPLDRRYIEAFLHERRGAIRGSVLEVQDDTYTARFASHHISESTVVDIDRSNRRATLITDLERPDSLSAAAYDCIILTQTLHLLRRPGQCVENCYRALRPAGVLLATAPSVSRVSPTYPETDYWRFTPAGIAELFARHWEGDFTAHALGNLRSCIGFLLGEVVEDLADTVFDRHDPRFPLTVAVEAHKT